MINMEQDKVYRLWKFIRFSDSWKTPDTSAIDDISPSWFERRKTLKGNSQEYEDFILRLKREHAIETGIVERMYDLKKGITETFIKEGFVQSYISHGDTNVPIPKLLSYLRDHFDSVNFVFDVVNENRPLTISLIKELHSLVTQHQDYAEGRDQLGNKLQIELIREKFKERENNPTREDGTVVLYCPPEQVDSEMDNLVNIYNDLVLKRVHPIVSATWFHHAFTTIHPFQDGNGRVARLLASLILIKNGFFPFTVLREEAKVKYIDALELADNGNPQKLVDYFIEVQKRNIEKALNLKEVTSSSFEEVTDIFTQKLQGWKQKQHKEKERKLAEHRTTVFDFCDKYLTESMHSLQKKLNGNVKISLESCSPSDTSRQHFYYGQIIKYAKKHDYFFNRAFPKAWLMFRIELSQEKVYQLGITIHHFGYDDSTIAIGAFLDFLSNETEERVEATLPLEIKPHVISINNEVKTKEKNIRGFLENALTLMIAQMASEI